jgi:hypothetical protein
MGNHQVRFLGEGAAEMPLPYPTPDVSDFLNVGERFSEECPDWTRP